MLTPIGTSIAGERTSRRRHNASDVVAGIAKRCRDVVRHRIRRTALKSPDYAVRSSLVTYSRGHAASPTISA